MALILCPSCQTLLRVSGDAGHRRCLTCNGVFVQREAIGPLAAQLRAGQKAAVVMAPYRTMATTGAEKVRPRLEADFSYRRCPFCSKHMNRVPIVDRSGVVIDLCLSHGAWFDANEIHRATKYIREQAGDVDELAPGDQAGADAVVLVLETYFAEARRATTEPKGAR